MQYNEMVKNQYLKKIFNKHFNIFSEESFNENIILKKKFSNININYDKNPCFIEFNSFKGGNDVNQLNFFFSNFYCKWLLKNNFDYDIINIEIAKTGYKKVLLLINNFYSFLLFKYESGIHRFFRKNPLLSSNKIQTSYLELNVLPFIDYKLNIKNEDLIVETYKSKGAGGQHVNTTNSAVRITHIPTSTVISCQTERSQNKNKVFALKILKYKLTLKKKTLINKFTKEYKNNNKYIKTYNFESNEIIDHLNKKKINLNKFFNYEINFINL